MPKTVPYRSLRRQPGLWRGNRLGPRWLGLVVRPRIALRQRNGGFSLIVIFLLVLSILTTTLALTSRTTGGLYAQSYQSKLRLAKDAAENGLVVVASEFNYPGNRRVIGGGKLFGIKVGTQNSDEINHLRDVVPEVMWGSNEIPPIGSTGETPSKPCYAYFAGGAIRQATNGDSDKNKNMIYAASVVPNSGNNNRFDGQSANGKNTTWFASIAELENNDFHFLGNGQFYRPIALRLYNSDHSKNSSIDSVDRSNPDPSEYARAGNNQVSYLTVVVEGVYAPRQALGKTRGDVVARDSISVDKNIVKYTMQQEFQVVPRCCSKGFGEVNDISYGPSANTNDSTNCPITTTTGPTGGTITTYTTTEWILRSVSRTSAFNSVP